MIELEADDVKQYQVEEFQTQREWNAMSRPMENRMQKRKKGDDSRRAKCAWVT